MKIVSQLISVIFFSCLLSAIFFLVTAPFIAVFIIDDAFSSTDFLRMLLWVGALTLGFTTLILVPASLILDLVFKKLTMARFWMLTIALNMLALVIYCYVAYLTWPTATDIYPVILNSHTSILLVIVITSYWLLYRGILLLLKGTTKLKRIFRVLAPN